GNGNLLIGQAYTRRMGLEPGEEFRIELQYETGSILLLPLSESTELNEAAEPPDGEPIDAEFSAFEMEDE
ncbi:MAG: AbrB-like transcriptional regulator, partial [Cyanobium sp.]